MPCSVFALVCLHGKTTVHARNTRTWWTTVILITGNIRRSLNLALCRDQDGAGSGISGLYLWVPPIIRIKKICTLSHEPQHVFCRTFKCSSRTHEFHTLKQVLYIVGPLKLKFESSQMGWHFRQNFWKVTLKCNTIKVKRSTPTSLSEQLECNYEICEQFCLKMQSWDLKKNWKILGQSERSRKQTSFFFCRMVAREENHML